MGHSLQGEGTVSRSDQTLGLGSFLAIKRCTGLKTRNEGQPQRRECVGRSETGSVVTSWAGVHLTGPGSKASDTKSVFVLKQWIFKQWNSQKSVRFSVICNASCSIF